MSRDRALLVFGVLVATACGSNTASEANRTVATTEQAAATTDAQLGAQDTGAQDTITQDTITQDTITQDTGVPEALRFRAPLVGGGEIDMSTLADKPVVLWFWAPY